MWAGSDAPVASPVKLSVTVTLPSTSESVAVPVCPELLSAERFSVLTTGAGVGITAGDWALYAKIEKPATIIAATAARSIKPLSSLEDFFEVLRALFLFAIVKYSQKGTTLSIGNLSFILFSSFILTVL